MQYKHRRGTPPLWRGKIICCDPATAFEIEAVPTPLSHYGFRLFKRRALIVGNLAGPWNSAEQLERRAASRSRRDVFRNGKQPADDHEAE